MKVWARRAAVMVLVDEDGDHIERVVMVAGERYIDRETMGDMLFYTEELWSAAPPKMTERHARKYWRGQRAHDEAHQPWPAAPHHTSPTTNRALR